MALWQWGYARHHQPAFRVRDRAPGDSSLLLETAPDGTVRLAADRDFRVDHDRERLVWTVDGEDYTKVFLPPNTLEYTAGNLIADMDYAGVDWALLHVDAALSKDVEYQAACVRAYPDRLRSMAPVDEWRIESEPDAVIAQAREAIEVHGLHALKIIPEYAYLLAGADGFDGPGWRPFWDAVTQLDVPIFFTLGAPPGVDRSSRQGFLDELWTLARWADRYPDARASVTHGFNWRHHRGRRPDRAVGRDVGAVPRPSEPDHRGQLRRPDRRPVRLSVDGHPARPRGAGREHRRRPAAVGHRHAVPEPLLHVPPVARRDRALLAVPRPGPDGRPDGRHGGPDPRASPDA